MRAGEADNVGLIGEICRAAVVALPLVRWPVGLPRDQAPELVWRYMTSRRYVEEMELQVIRLPRAFVLDSSHDCKSSAVFAAAMLNAAGYNVVLRFVTQPERWWWSHVYCVADGVPVDPLLPLGREVSYLQRFDYNPTR
jgi:hypothetical protein